MDLKEAIEIIDGRNTSSIWKFAAAAKVVRDVVVEEHPPDDDEPITREWLEEHGYDNINWEDLLEHFFTPPPDVKPGDVIKKTRGDVRRLIKALGGEP